MPFKLERMKIIISDHLWKSYGGTIAYYNRGLDKACATSLSGGRFSYFLKGFITNSNLILTHLGKQNAIHILY